MKRLIIIGAGGHGRVIADAACLTKSWYDIVFVDDMFPDVPNIETLQIVGNTDSLDNVNKLKVDIIVGVGDNSKRLELIDYFSKSGFNIASVVHPTAYVSSQADIKEGTVVFANAVVNSGAVVGRGCIINTGATVDHGCALGDGVHISPGVNLAGNVSIESCSWVGIGASVIQSITIGKSAVIGAGSVIIDDVPDQVTVVGCPGKIIKHMEG